VLLSEVGGLGSSRAGAAVLGEGSGWDTTVLVVDPPAGNSEEIGLGTGADRTVFLGSILDAGLVVALDITGGVSFLGPEETGVGKGGFLGDIKLVPYRESCGPLPGAGTADLRMGVSR
jgi:hypothetical protein